MDMPSQTMPPAQRERDALRPSLLADETGDVPGWVLITLMTAGLPVVPELV